MKAMLCVLLATTSGCFASWGTVQAMGKPHELDTGGREERVHAADVREFLHVTVLFIPRENAPVEIGCNTTQVATDTVHSSVFRYGGGFRKAAAIAFAVEAGIAAAIYFGADHENTGAMITAGVFAADALGSAALVMVPRKEISGRAEVKVSTPIRTDCPDGMTIEIAGETFPIDAAGHIGELGEAAHEAWKHAPMQPMHITYRDRVVDLRDGMTAVIEVPMGTLTAL